VDSNFRFRNALSSPTARAWSRPPDLAVSGGALNGLTTPIGGRPATPRLTREDRSAHPTIGIREQIAAVLNAEMAEFFIAPKSPKRHSEAIEPDR